MSATKVYARQTFKNDSAPYLNDTNLNKVDYAVDEIDSRVVKLMNEQVTVTLIDDETLRITYPD